MSDIINRLTKMLAVSMETTALDEKTKRTRELQKFFLKEWGWFPGKDNSKLVTRLKDYLKEIPKEWRTVKGKTIYRVLVIKKDSLRRGKTIKLDNRPYSSWSTSLKFAEWFMVSASLFAGSIKSKHSYKAVMEAREEAKQWVTVVIKKEIRPANVIVYLPAVLKDSIYESQETKSYRIKSEGEVIIKNNPYYRTIEMSEIVKVLNGYNKISLVQYLKLLKSEKET